MNNEQKEVIEQPNVSEQPIDTDADQRLMSVFEPEEGTNDASGNPNDGEPIPDGNNDPNRQSSGETEWEKRYRELQSKYDKLYHTNEEVVTDYQEALKAKEFLAALMEDEEVFEAFVYEKKPELINKKDLQTELKERLSNEFGEYHPSRDDADPQALLYFKRFDELYNELSHKKQPPKTLKELEELRANERKMQEEQIQKEVERAKEVMKWDDNTVKNFHNWAKNLKVVDMMKMYNFALKTQRVPNLSSMPGSPKPPTTARESFLKGL